MESKTKFILGGTALFIILSVYLYGFLVRVPEQEKINLALREERAKADLEIDKIKQEEDLVIKERRERKEARKKAEREKGKTAKEIEEMYARDRLLDYKYKEIDRLRETIDDKDSSKSEVIIATEKLKKLIDE